MNLELLNAIHAFEGSKALQGYLGSPRDKLEELGTVSLVKRTQCSPEPLNLEEGTQEASVRQGAPGKRGGWDWESRQVSSVRWVSVHSQDEQKHHLKMWSRE